MEAGLGRGRGGIRGLLELIRQHREAVEYDLIALGLRLDWLGSERLSWRDLWVVVQQRPTASALSRAIEPDAVTWGLSEQLIAAAVDTLRIANWQRGEAKRSQFPKPISRPGVEPEFEVIGSGAGLPMDEMARRLGWAEVPDE